MKILIFYTPRSKSTMLNELLCKKYQLTNFGDTVTKSRIKNKNFNEYYDLIKVINESKKICVKLNGNDFINPTTGTINKIYETIDFRSFDKIIMLTRDNYIEAILSYAYMDPNNSDTWHRKKTQTIDLRKYTIPPAKIYHLLNGYLAYNSIKTYILSVVDPATVVQTEFNTLSSLVSDLELDTVNIDLCPMDIDYRSIVTNYDEVVDIANAFFQKNKNKA